MVEMPQESRKPEVNEVSLLNKVIFGMRDADMCWEAEVASLVMGPMAFVQGRGSPCDFTTTRQLRVSVHGHDVTIFGIHA